MHDKSLEAIFADRGIDAKMAESEIRQMSGMLIAGVRISDESTAVTLYGYTMTALRRKDVTAKDVKVYLESLTKKRIVDMTEIERLALLALGFLHRKPQRTPFQPVASKVGRNELCPCGSGKKFKLCCLDLAKAHDLEEYKRCLR